MSVDIGGQLRFVRSRHKLSQRELAKRSGVTNSTISLIESNQMNPSVGALKRILDGIPMGLAEFFAIEPERPRKAFYRSDGPSGPLVFLDATFWTSTVPVQALLRPLLAASPHGDLAGLIHVTDDVSDAMAVLTSG